MFVLDPPSDVTTSQILVRFISPLFFKKRHQASGQGPESQVDSSWLSKTRAELFIPVIPEFLVPLWGNEFGDIFAGRAVIEELFRLFAR